MRWQGGKATDRIPADERFRRIAELLGKAVLLAEAKRMTPSRASLAVSQTGRHNCGTQIDHQILSYLSVSGKATPLVIRSALGLSRTTAYRSFQRLHDAGYIVGEGRAKALSYRLSRQEPPPDKIGLN
jgi:DNA-binding MarR family transcriptional regulator